MITTKNQTQKYNKMKSEYDADSSVCDEIKQIRQKHPDRIPVKIILHKDCSFTLTKLKYLVPNDLTYGQFLYVIRNRIKLPESKALFMFFNDELPKQTDNMTYIYDTHKSKDGFLRATISEENTFG